MTEHLTIDINADIGEGFGQWELGDDAGLLEVITSANVACGFHGGDPLIMRRVGEMAVERGVVIGAQVSYRDIYGFGRWRIDIPADVLMGEVLYQLAALDGIARTVGGRVAYVKPHGALNHATLSDEGQASAVVQAITAYDANIGVLAQPSSQLAAHSEAAGLRTVVEGFPDRAYLADGTLVSRRDEGAVVHDSAEVAKRAVVMAREQRVVAVDGSTVSLDIRSLCIHGDSPGAADSARRVRTALEESGIDVASFI